MSGEQDTPQGQDTPAQEASRPDEASESKFQQLRKRFSAWRQSRLTQTEAKWEEFYEGVQHKRIVTKVILLHARYTFGYMAAGFLVSAPIQLGAQHALDASRILRCLVLGLMCTVVFLLLWPFSNIDWGRMRLPEFKNFELAVTRWAAYLAGGYLGLSLLARLYLAMPVFGGDDVDGASVWQLFDVRVAWLNLILMFFAWLRVRFHTLLFREFYTLKPGDDLVLSREPTSAHLRRPEPSGEGEDQAGETQEEGEKKGEGEDE